MDLLKSHVSIDKLADAIDDRLSPVACAEVQQHLNSCSRCQAEFDVLDKSIALMRSDRAAEAPAEALNFAKNLFRTRRQFAPRETIGQKINAVLRLDLSNLAPAFGERSAATGEQRQMLFSAGDADVDVQIRKSGGNFVVAGQILGEFDFKENTVRLSAENLNFETTINKTGEFVFYNVASGIYELEIAVGDYEIAISNLQV